MQIGLIVHTLILNDQNQTLIIKRASHREVLPNIWDIPGGTLEPGKDPKAGAIREIREETNLDINDLKLFDYTHNIDQEKNKQFIRLIFIADYKQGEIKLNPEEHEEFKWIDINNPKEKDLVCYLPDLLTKYVKENF